MASPKKTLGAPVGSGPSTWVQTERAAHEAFAQLIRSHPKAAMMMHQLISLMGHQNAVVISQKNLADLLGISLPTAKRAIAELIARRWIQAVQVSGTGSVCAYIINDRIAWGQSRDHRRTHSIFSAAVVAYSDEQTPDALDTEKLRRLPMIYPPEKATPVGHGEPGAQMLFDGMEPVIEGAPREPNFEE